MFQGTLNQNAIFVGENEFENLGHKMAQFRLGLHVLKEINWNSIEFSA